MNGNFFIDTNLLIYLCSTDTLKQQKAKTIIYGTDKGYISTQVLGEFANATLRKKLLTPDEVTDFITMFTTSLQMAIIHPLHVQGTLTIKKKHLLSFWDSLIIATALAYDCAILYSEDLHHGLVINDKLKIVNPFL